MRGSRIVPKQFVDDFEKVAEHYQLKQLGEYDQAKQLARDDIEQAIICYSQIAKTLSKGVDNETR